MYTPPPTVFVSSLPGGGRMFIGTRACSMERIESAPQCCLASAPRSVPTHLLISWKLGMASRHSWKRLRSLCFTTPPHTLDRRRPPPPQIRFFEQKRFPVGGISSRLRALLLRRMASWKGRFSSRRSLLTTRGADTGDFKSPALALGRGAGTRAESSTNQN